MERHILFTRTVCVFSMFFIFSIITRINALPTMDTPAGTDKSIDVSGATEAGDFSSTAEELVTTETPTVSTENVPASSETVSSSQTSATVMDAKNYSQSTTNPKIPTAPSTKSSDTVQGVGSAQPPLAVQNPTNNFVYDTNGTDNSNSSIDIVFEGIMIEFSTIEETTSNTEVTDSTQTESASENPDEDLTSVNDSQTPVLGDSTPGTTSEESGEGQGLDSSNVGATTRKIGDNVLVVCVGAILLALRPTLS